MSTLFNRAHGASLFTAASVMLLSVGMTQAADKASKLMSESILNMPASQLASERQSLLDPNGKLATKSKNIKTDAELLAEARALFKNLSESTNPKKDVARMRDCLDLSGSKLSALGPQKDIESEITKRRIHAETLRARNAVQAQFLNAAPKP